MIAHVSIHVLNYEKSKDFYVKAIAPLGYEVVMDLPQHKVMGMGVKGNPDLWIVERKENLGGEHAAILVGDKKTGGYCRFDRLIHPPFQSGRKFQCGLPFS